MEPCSRPSSNRQFTNASRFGGCDTSEPALDWVVSKRALSAGKFVSAPRAPTGFAAVLSDLARASSCPVSNTPLIDQDSHSNVIWPEPSFAARRAPRASVRSAARGHQLFCRPLDHRLRCPRYVHRDSVTALVRNAGAGLRRRRWSRWNPADLDAGIGRCRHCACAGCIPARQISRCDPRPTNPTARLREDTWFGC
jgi:hypothetical protein